MENNQEIREIKEPNPRVGYFFLIGLVLSFFGALLIIIYIFPSYRDHLVKKDLDNFGYYPQTKERLEEDRAILFGYSVIDAEKGIVRRPIQMAVPKVLERYQNQ